MKKFFIEALVIALMFIAGASVASAFCFDNDAPFITFIAERAAFASACIGSYLFAEKLYRKYLATGRQAI